MKKINKFLLSLCAAAILIMSVGMMSVFAEETGVLSNTVFEAEQGSQFSTIIYMKSGSNIIDFQTEILYDKDSLELVSAAPVSGLVGNMETGTDTAGVISVNYTKVTGNMTNETQLLQLTFKVNNNLNDGVHDLFSINDEATEAHTFNGENIENAVLSSEFSSLTLYGSGDVNMDSKISIADATYVRQYLNHMRELSDVQLGKANTVGSDNTVDISDAVRIQQSLIYKNLVLGNRANVTFYVDGEVYAVKSVPIGSALTNIPSVPHKEEYSDGSWDVTDFSNISASMSVNAVYGYTGQTEAGKATYEKVLTALDTGFIQSGKYVANNFQLPYKNTYGTFNMLSSKEFSDVDILWSIDSGLLAQSVVIGNDYIVTVPDLDYTTSVTFTAYVYIDGILYGTQAFDREIKGKIDLPNSNTFKEIIDAIPTEIEENYRLPGSVSLESDRMNYGVKMVQNVDIKWTLVEGEEKGFDASKNQLIYLKKENYVTLKADFIFDGYSVYSQTITRTIPAKSIEGQREYAKEYLSKYVPSMLSGETLFPYQIDLYDLTVTWRPNTASGKITVGSNTVYKDQIYTPLSVGPKAGYMEEGSIIAHVERNGDTSFRMPDISFPIQLVGDSTEITNAKIPDMNLYKSLLKTFDTKYGNDDGVLTEEEIFDPDVAEKLDYTLNLSNLGIENLSGIYFLTRYRSINLSGNELGGSDANLANLAGLVNLEQINLSNCGISEVPREVFRSMYAIEGIDLSYNNLTNLNFLDQDRKFTELTDLLVQGNDISDISALSYVNGNGKTVSTVPNAKRLTLSRKLDSENKNVMDITPIGMMKDLTVLWLANNGINDITPLENCSLLTTLDLSNNKISAPNANSDGLYPLSNLQSLICLMLDDNDITTVRSLRKLYNLQELSMSNNNIGSVDALSSLTNLTYLDLDENNLTAFNAATYKNLCFLYLEDNNIEQLVSIGDLKNLYQLRLSYNLISNPDTYDEIGGLENLYYLSLSGNSVGSLSFLEKLTNLQQLEMDNCAICQYYTVINDEGEEEEKDSLESLSGLTNLRVLDISQNNDISNITALGQLTGLTALYMDGINLTHWSPLSRMTGLKYLSMQNSGVTDLDFTSSLTGLKYLNLSGHSAPEIDFNNFRYYENITQLFLDSAVESRAYNIKTGLTNAIDLSYLSLRNINVESMDNLPEMDNLIYLNLQNTGIKDFRGSYSDVDGYIFAIDRFRKLKAVFVRENDELFTHDNLNFLYDHFNGKVDVYLYTPDDMPYDVFMHADYTDEEGKTTTYMAYKDDGLDHPSEGKFYEDYLWGSFDPDLEIEKIKENIDFGKHSEDISIAVIETGQDTSNRGYQLPTSVNGFSIDWSMESMFGCYIEDNKLFYNKSLITEPEITLHLTATVHDLYGSDYPISYTETVSFGTQTVSKTISENELVTEDLAGWSRIQTIDATYSEYGDWQDTKDEDGCEEDSRKIYKYYYVTCPSCGGRMGIYGHSSSDSRIKTLKCFACGYKTQSSTPRIVETWSEKSYEEVEVKVLNAEAEYTHSLGDVWFLDKFNELSGDHEKMQYRYKSVLIPKKYVYTKNVSDGLMLKVE